MTDPMYALEPVHLRPERDLLVHDWEDCACQPSTQIIECENGHLLLMMVHNAWDGRD